jgi:uncharacterized protein YdiU (UPF0061 family)
MYVALAALAVSAASLIYVIRTGRRTTRLNKQTAATWDRVATTWAEIAELNQPSARLTTTRKPSQPNT